jgi:uncharacterized membrane protein
MSGKNPARFFSRQDKAAIQQAIAEAEQHTSGEIRVHLVSQFAEGLDPLEEGRKIFEHLGMTATAGRNGILFLLELKQQQLVILGDRGIHEKVPENFWQEIRDVVLQGFQQKDFAGGLIRGIERCGEKLKTHFPHRKGDLNELSDEITEQ